MPKQPGNTPFRPTPLGRGREAPLPSATPPRGRVHHNSGPQPTARLTLTLSAGANGSVAAYPPWLEYTAGTEVTVVATPNAGYVFDTWMVDGEANVTHPLVLTMDDDHTVAASFVVGP